MALPFVCYVFVLASSTRNLSQVSSFCDVAGESALIIRCNRTIKSYELKYLRTVGGYGSCFIRRVSGLDLF